MTRLTLDLADDLSARLQARAAETGHASVEEYVRALPPLRSRRPPIPFDEDFGGASALGRRFGRRAGG